MTKRKMLTTVLVSAMLAGCSKGPEAGPVQNDNADPWAGDWMARAAEANARDAQKILKATRHVSEPANGKRYQVEFGLHIDRQMPVGGCDSYGMAEAFVGDGYGVWDDSDPVSQWKKNGMVCEIPSGSGGEVQGIEPFQAVDMYPQGRGLYIYKIKINKCSNGSLIGKTVWVDGRDVFNIR